MRGRRGREWLLASGDGEAFGNFGSYWGEWPGDNDLDEGLGLMMGGNECTRSIGHAAAGCIYIPR